MMGAGSAGGLAVCNADRWDRRHIPERMDLFQKKRERLEGSIILVDTTARYHGFYLHMHHIYSFFNPSMAKGSGPQPSSLSHAGGTAPPATVQP